MCAGKAQESEQSVAMQQQDNAGLAFMIPVASCEWRTKIDLNP